jgi:hypothetical protein
MYFIDIYNPIGIEIRGATLEEACLERGRIFFSADLSPIFRAGERALEFARGR